MPFEKSPSVTFTPAAMGAIRLSTLFHQLPGVGCRGPDVVTQPGDLNIRVFQKGSGVRRGFVQIG